MRLTDIGGDLAAAFSLLTRLPLRASDAALSRGAMAAWAFPVTGMVIGALSAMFGSLTLAMGLPAPLAALTALATAIITTGAMHEDGLADAADGLWGGWTRERRLEIMKDSHIGSYGVIAVVLSLAARWSAITVLIISNPAALIATATLSRAAMTGLMAALPNARPNGLSRSTGRPSPRSATIGIALAFAVCLVTTNAPFTLLIIAALTTAGIAMIAKAKIGGQTGDILGATQQVTEIALLATLL